MYMCITSTPIPLISPRHISISPLELYSLLLPIYLSNSLLLSPLLLYPTPLPLFLFTTLHFTLPKSLLNFPILSFLFHRTFFFSFSSPYSLFSIPALTFFLFSPLFSISHFLPFSFCITFYNPTFLSYIYSILFLF